ncbi:MAG: glutamine synthetase III [Clostridia bacterium]|nr:glutamine synthetase III [Clostridia bacterium]
MLHMDELFGSLVFNDRVMKERLPEDIYKQVRQTKEKGVPLTREVADVMANAMKDWAIERGVTHFAHWFQPMTGVTAEKHDSFITPSGVDQVIMEFSGKELIKSEPDASSFPSGGLRSTFEARGYTAWDPTVNAFIKDNILCIPTIFCSYTGEALDKKTPLMRSLETLNTQALRVLRLFGDTETKRVETTVGPEQEYFLIDRKVAAKRRDLTFTGRTLFGAMPPKGQELDDHYFGVVKERVSAYMRDLDQELWKLGILAKTKHNEAAPSQHELAPIYCPGNIATDHNQLTMELMKKIAEKHSMKCLLHEKPFAGVNGSGKHDNWAVCTDRGENLLKPGKRPHENLRFLTFLCAVIGAVDEYQDLLRVTVATAGNDHRLGAAEAPPAIISIFLGDELTEILTALESGSDYSEHKKEIMETGGVDALPNFVKDTTDRNRTSPFAFTGNKFEFRMPGSSLSVSGPNFILNTAVAEFLKRFADQLEGKENFEESLKEVLRETLKEHKRIIFNGNNYSEEWKNEAERRGLSNRPSTPEALPAFMDEKNLKLFADHHILTRDEAHSRYEINLDNYSKVINIEAMTMMEMVRQDILPAVEGYLKTLSQTLLAKKQVCPDAETGMEDTLIRKLSDLSWKLFTVTEELEASVRLAKAIENKQIQAEAYRDQVLSKMETMRSLADTMELYTPKEAWPMPTYGDLLFSIQ